MKASLTPTCSKLVLLGTVGSQRAAACLQGSSTDSSILGTRSTHKLAARQRHALFNDFTLTIPFGIVNGIAGAVSLAFKVTFRTYTLMRRFSSQIGQHYSCNVI